MLVTCDGEVATLVKVVKPEIIKHDNIKLCEDDLMLINAKNCPYLSWTPWYVTCTLQQYNWFQDTQCFKLFGGINIERLLLSRYFIKVGRF